MPEPPTTAYAAMATHLVTERLTLSPEVESDAPWLAELFNERGDRRYSLDDALEKIRVNIERLATLGIGALAVRETATGTPLGYVAIVVGRGSVDEPELAYELLPRAHGHGFATEASRALVEAAFATGRARLWSTVRTWNEPSLRVLARLGFRRDHITSDERGEIVWHAREDAP